MVHHHFFIVFCALITFLVPFEVKCDIETKNQHHVNVFLIGTGVVGNALLEQIELKKQHLNEQFGLDIHLTGIANSRKMMYLSQGLKLQDWIDCPEVLEHSMLWDLFFNEVKNSNLTNKVFVDCTSSQTIADAYLPLLNSGVSIVTPNKKANSGPYQNYHRLKETVKKTNALFLYDANVGAGLPILNTVNGLIKSGDQIVKIEAILSGTLSYIFNHFDEHSLFSTIVQDAQKKGYTEPDPRDDLNGMDVARKLLIIMREAGHAAEMNDIELIQFLPSECFEAASVEDFYKQLENFDEQFSKKIELASLNGKKLRFIASFENGKGTISLQAVGQEHPFYHLNGNDNIAAITTNYYNQNPIVIQGPGAGADVTAARVLEGIVRVGLEGSNNER